MDLKTLLLILEIVDSWILDALGGPEFAQDCVLEARAALVNSIIKKNTFRYPLTFITKYAIIN